MKKLFLMLLAVMPALLFSQDTKKINDRENGEVYHVLKSDPNTRHGLYQKYGFGNKLLAEGMFEYGAQSGIWKYFDTKGEVIQEYDHSTRELVSFQLSEEAQQKQYLVLQGDHSSMMTLDRPPIFIGGNALMLRFIYGNIQYPAEARKWGIEGDVEVAFTIDEQGFTSNFRIVKGIGYGCDEEVLYWVESLPPTWVAAWLAGKPVAVEYILPVRFSLE